MNPAQQDALRYALMTGLGAGGLGAGAAILSHLSNASKRPALVDLATMAPETINIPYPKKKKKLEELEEKQAGGMSDWLTGANAKHWWEIPIVPAGIVGTGLAAGMGGQSLVKNYLLNRRKKDIKRQVDAAEEDYRNALLNAYDKEDLDIEKKSAIKEINEGLDKLASVLKIAKVDLSKVPVPSAGTSVGSAIGDAASSAYNASGNLYNAMKDKLGLNPGEGVRSGLNTIGGLALLTAAGIPTLTGIAAYKYFKSKNKSKMLNEAAKERQYARLTENVPEMYAGVED